MSYVYIRSRPGVYTVGWEHTNGVWESESDWGSQEEAGERVHFLNGGDDNHMRIILEAIASWKQSPEGVKAMARSALGYAPPIPGHGESYEELHHEEGRK